MTAILGILAGILILFLFGKALTRWNLLAKLYDVRISKQGIEFTVLSRLVVYTLDFGNIEQVIEGYGGYHFLSAFDLRNRFFGRCFLILKKRGFFTRKALISPADPESFIQRLDEIGVPVKTKAPVKGSNDI